MRKLLTNIVSILLAVAACDGNDNLREVIPVAEQILLAAYRGDSVTIARLSSDSVAYRQFQVLARLEPELIRSAVSDLEISDGWVRPDTIVVHFLVVIADGEETLQMSFVRREGEWLLRYIALPERSDVLWPGKS